MTLPIPHLVPLAAGLLVAVVCDLRHRRIPNLVSGFVLLSALTIRTLDEGVGASLAGLGAAALVVAALYRPWSSGGIGGGDVKLAGATAAWVPFSDLHWYVLSGAAMGGAFALIYFLRSRSPARAEIRANLTLAVLQNELPTVPTHRAGHLSLPYSLAIASGAVAVFVFLR